jgi:MFS-type transporter involved in bile tolerance (Atg22 family)
MMKLFSLSISTMVVRYYLMMLVVVISGFTDQWWFAVLALPLFLSAVLGVRLGEEVDGKGEAKIRRLETTTAVRKAG